MKTTTFWNVLVVAWMHFALAVFFYHAFQWTLAECFPVWFMGATIATGAIVFASVQGLED